QPGRSRSSLHLRFRIVRVNQSAEVFPLRVVRAVRLHVFALHANGFNKELVFVSADRGQTLRHFNAVLLYRAACHAKQKAAVVVVAVHARTAALCKAPSRNAASRLADLFSEEWMVKMAWVTRSRTVRREKREVAIGPQASTSITLLL